MAKLSSDEWAKAREKWEGSSKGDYVSIGRFLGVSHTTVSRRSTKEGWVKKSEKKRTEPAKNAHERTGDNKESISGNPKKIVPVSMGRPAGSPNKLTRSMKEYAAQYGDDVIDFFVSVLNCTVESDEPPRISERIQAGKELLDRGFGRPAQTVEVSGDVDMVVSLDELDLILQEGLEKIQQQRDELPERLAQLKSGEWIN